MGGCAIRERAREKSTFCHFVVSLVIYQTETFPDMNGKRVKATSCARTCSIITIKCNVGELSERPQGIPTDTRSPNVHKESPDYPPHFSVRLQCRPSTPLLTDVFAGPSEGTHTHTHTNTNSNNNNTNGNNKNTPTIVIIMGYVNVEIPRCGLT